MLSLSAGSDPTYLTKAVGQGAEHYYLRSIDQAGEPPGIWIGRGCAELGLEPGAEIDADVFTDLFTDFTDPRRRDAMTAALAAIPHDPHSPAYDAEAKRIRKEARLGNAPKSFERTFDKRFAAAVDKAREQVGGELAPEQLKQIELQVRKDLPGSTRYYDLTFSAPKSWSVYHASLQVKAAEAREAGDPEGADHYARQADQVWDCWMEGVRAGVEYLEDQAGYARAGHHGERVNGQTTGRYVKAEGFTGAAFRQHTSRNDDPQLHVHVPINRQVKTTDLDPVTRERTTVWRAVDSRGLFKHKQAAGHLAERVATEALEHRMAVRVEMRPDGKVREIVGIAPEMRAQFSTRRHGIVHGVEQLAQAYEARHGHRPGPYALARMSEFVTLEQRQAKRHDAVPREQLLERWERAGKAALCESLATVPEQVAATSAERAYHQPYDGFDPRRVQARAIARVQEAKATWTRPDLLVALDKELPDTLGGLDRHQTRALLDRLADEALSPGTGHRVVSTAPPRAVEIPVELQRADGSFVYEPPPQTTTRYVTEEHLEAEERLREFAGRRGAPTVPYGLVEEVVERRGLEGEQAAFLRQAAISGRMVDFLVAPAGAGKSYTVSALTEVWEANGGRVIGLAGSQRAADVLKEEGISNVANIDMLVHTNRALADGAQLADADLYRIRPGQLVIVDEASMATTRQHLDNVRALCDRAGAKLLLSGDPAQLGSPGAGGMFADLVRSMPGVHVFDEVRRFRDVDPGTGEQTVRRWEAEASLKLRAGDADALAAYQTNGRLRGGSAEEMKARAYQGWLTDHLEGRNPLLIVGDNETAAELSARARADLVRAGRVGEEGVELHTGRDYGVETRAGCGDIIQMRRNDRSILGDGGTYAVNRLTATVTSVGPYGSLAVRLDDGADLHLPASYVRAHVELAYASTVHASEGRTVGCGHSLIGPSSTREELYVSLSRGTARNEAYVMTDGAPHAAEAPHHLAVLTRVLERSGLEPSAGQHIRDEQERASHLAAVEPIWSNVKDQVAAERYGRALYEALGAGEYRRLTAEKEYPTLLRLAREVEEQGFDAENLLVRTARSRELHTADSYSKVLHYRLKKAYQLAEQDQIRAERSEQRAAVRAQEQAITTVIGRVQLPETLNPVKTSHSPTAPSPTADGLHPYAGDLLAQALDMQQLPVAHANQDVEVRHRQAAGRAERMELTDSYLSRTPEIDGDLGRAMRGWAAQMDARTEVLGVRLAEEPPAWALDRLGPVPRDAMGRADWEQRAGRVERYREAHGYHQDHDAIGSAPPPGAVEARADWERARLALGVPEDQADITRALDQTLRGSVERWDREQAWAPAYVADDLERAALAGRDYRVQATQLDLNARELAERETADHTERVTRAAAATQTPRGGTREEQALAQVLSLQQAPTLQASIEPSARHREIEERAHVSRAIADTMATREEKLREINEVRERWWNETQQVREEAAHARLELQRRNPTDPGEPTRPPTPEARRYSIEADIDLHLERAREAHRSLTERARARTEHPARDEETDRARRDDGFAHRADHDADRPHEWNHPAEPAPTPPVLDLEIEM
ncbi:ATP-dependent RecD-like DNA helicase [Streptomyces sp. RB5]|uniref:ATP-dependent RecD-like DNA helicase n=1 Tax=Streptomyces smaragdinus TaxID=2585196 RepID=A0A7K0CNV0_9ACTN|nr:MobF family relaxase [Streptomyces smaragdinus]MQY15167.1 ATP-dependent RecD-like DNA helicase [Streptomyces smaragdinus]